MNKQAMQRYLKIGKRLVFNWSLRYSLKKLRLLCLLMFSLVTMPLIN